MEIMVVIGVILLLLGIGVIGYRSLDRSTAEGTTRTALANAQAMLANYEAVNGLSEINKLGSKASSGVMPTLLRMQKNKEAFNGMPTKLVKENAILDGWGNEVWLYGTDGVNITTGPWSSSASYSVGQIVSEDGSGKHGTHYRCTQAHTNKPTTDTAYWSKYVGTAVIKSPANRPFWASPGADGDFKRPDDNVYSFTK